MHTDYFWPLWVMTVGVCAWKIVEGFFRPQRMLEWPFLASAMWAYFYGFMAYDAKVSLAAYLVKGMAGLGQLMPLLCLLGILFGWRLGTQPRGDLHSDRSSYPLFGLWFVGFFFLMVGAAGGLSVMRAAQAETLQYGDSSAYWYLLFYVGYPGLAIAVWSLLKMNSPSRWFLWIATLAGLAAFMFPHLFSARRGPLFPAIITLLLVPAMAKRRPPNPFIFCGALAFAGLMMLLFLQIRDVTYKGGTWAEAVKNLSLESAIEKRGKEAEDNEYVNNCQVIWTVCQNGKYQYGTGHFSLLYHWIPRAIWKSKPELGEGKYSFKELFDDVETATGFHLLGSGASAGGVADTFIQYGLFCPLFWAGLSWAAGRAYVHAVIEGGPRWIFCYVGFLCACHWLVSQSFSAAFVPGMCFQSVPLIVFALIRGARQTLPNKSTGRSRLVHRRENRSIAQS